VGHGARSVIRILTDHDPAGRYLLGQRALEVAELPGAAQSMWRGEGARRLGLEGAVEADDLVAVLAGRPPGTSLRPSARRRRTASDVVVAAPKDASVLFASPDPEQAAQVLAAHEASVGEALSYLEQRAAAVVRHEAGDRVELGVDGLVVAGFTHGLSRSGDPHLHTHLLVANLARAEDGRFSPLATGGLHFHARAADALYRAQLRAELGRRLGVAFERRADGSLVAAGITEGTLVAVSGRGAELRQWGRGSGETAGTPTRAEAVEEWTRRLRSPPELDGPARRSVGDRIDEHRLAGRLHGTSPTARQVLEGICDAAGPGLDASVAAQLLAHPQLHLGRGTKEPALPARSFLPGVEPLRRLGERPLERRELERWWSSAERLERAQRLRSGPSLEIRDRQGSSR
jgi:conjugative relaxase-like TrwC/TraI family protein